MLKRTEWINGKDGREYYINIKDERKVIEKEPLKEKNQNEKSRIIENAVDSLEDGYNYLEDINGQLFEIYEDFFVRIERKAYLNIDK